jgi:hypothetical protein
MEEGISSLVTRKDIVEKHWVEFLTFLKEKQSKDKEVERKRRLEAIERLASEEPYSGLANSLDVNRYYGIDINSFWCWYMEYKIEVKS